MNYLQFKCKEKKYFSNHPLMGAILLTIVLLVLLVGTSEALAAELPTPSIYLPVTIQGTSIAVSPTQSNTVTSPTATPQRDCTPDSEFVRDVTIEDGTTLTVGTPFTKTWAVRNTGDCTWSDEYSIVFVDGNSDMNAISGSIPFVEAGENVSITLPMVAPTDLGDYIGTWRLQYADGAFFGDALSVLITVVEITSTTISTPTAALTNTLTVTSTVTVTPTNTPSNTPTATVTATPTNTLTNTPTATETATITPTNTPTSTATVTPSNTQTPMPTETPIPEAGLTASPVPPEPPDPTDPTDPITWVLEQFSNPNPLVFAAIAGVLLLIVLIFAFLRLFRKKGGPDGPESPAPTSSGPPPTEPSGLNGAQVPPVMAPPPLGTPYLESLARPAGKVYYPLTQSVIMLGRDQNDHLTIDESFVGWHTVSRKHAKLEQEGKNMILVDLNSENGVYVNDLPTGENLLLNDCAITLGQVQFAFRLNQGGASR